MNSSKHSIKLIANLIAKKFEKYKKKSMIENMKDFVSQLTLASIRLASSVMTLQQLCF